MATFNITSLSDVQVKEVQRIEKELSKKLGKKVALVVYDTQPVALTM